MIKFQRLLGCFPIGGTEQLVVFRTESKMYQQIPRGKKDRCCTQQPELKARAVALEERDPRGQKWGEQGLGTQRKG